MPSRWAPSRKVVSKTWKSVTSVAVTRGSWEWLSGKTKRPPVAREVCAQPEGTARYPIMTRVVADIAGSKPRRGAGVVHRVHSGRESAAGEGGEAVADVGGAHRPFRLAGGQVEGDGGVDLARQVAAADVVE